MYSRKISIAILVVFLVSLFWNNETVHGVLATRTWDGGGPTNNWSDAANWSGDSVPVPGDFVVFDSSSAKDASVDVEVNVASINIDSGYAGTISVNNGVNMTFTGGGNASSQAGGTFTNGNGTITFASSFSFTGGIFNTKNGTVNFNGSFNQSGGLFNDLTLVNDGNINLGQFSNMTINGGTFNAPSGTLTANGAFTFTSGTFNHRNGTVVFAGPTNVFLGIQPSQIVFNNLTINKANGSNVALFPQVDRTARVTGTLTLTEGMINANTNSVIRAEGQVSIDPGFGEPSNNPPGGNGFLLFQNGPPGRVVSIPAGASLPNVTVDDPNITVAGVGSGTVRFSQLAVRRGIIGMGAVDVVAGFGSNPCYDQSGGTFSMGSGNFLCQSGFRLEQTDIANPSLFIGGSGNFTLNSPGNTFHILGGTFTAPSGSTVINTGELNANLNQSGGTFNANGSFDCQCAAFNQTGGIFNATSGTSTFRRNFNRSAGTFNANGGTVIFTSAPGGGQTGATTFNNLTIAYSGNNHTFSDATVLGNLILQSGELDFPGGEFDVKGNITVESTFPGVNRDITLSGSADQVLTNNGGVNPSRNWTVDKPAGRVILATDIDLSNGPVFFNLDNAIIQTDSHLLDLGTRSVFDNGGTPQGSNYIIGNLRRSFTGGGQDITRQFDVGTATGYARVLVRVPFTPGPTLGTLTPLTVSTVSAPHPFLDPASSVGLFWRITEGAGLVNSNVTFQYPQAGVSGNEANYVLYRINNGQIRIVNSTIFISTNTATIEGTSDFTGEWAIGERPPQLILNPTNLITYPGQITAYGASGGRPPYSFALVENNSGSTLQQTSATSVNYVAGPTVGSTDRLRLTDSLGTTRDAVISVIDPFVVINTNDSGVGSLRQAITNSNQTPGVQTISFNLPGAQPYTIQPATPLPSLNDPVVIDGTTQPGFSGTPLIELKGPGTLVGLDILGGGSTVKGLVINNWLLGIRLYYIGGNTISGNYIGTNAAGDQPRPNSVGIFVSTPEGNVIGGASPAERNVISGNEYGVRILAGTANVIKGNYIGLNAAGIVGMNDLSQLRQVGIHATTQALTIGGAATGEGNIISGNLKGLVIEDSQGLVVKGNKFGTNAAGTGTNALANGDAIRLQRTQNTQIGGIAAGEGNLIRESLASGIRLLGTENQVSIRGNSITANAGLGIDTKLNGVSPNDNCDLDGAQNFPVLTSVSNTTSGGTRITGDLNSRPGEQFTIDFYSNSVVDSNGYGEGKTYIGSMTVSTNNQCVRQDFFVNLPIQLTTEQIVTATATDSSGRTSEFSPAIGATSAIRGTVLNSAGQPIANTTVSLRDANTQDLLRTKLTDSNGRFEFIGLNTNFDYLVNPLKNNYSFNPPSRTYNLGAPVDDSWTGTLGTSKITGQITMDGVALGGVQLALSGASTGTEETSLNGNYTFNNLPSGTYTVTPALAGRVFTPASATVTIGGDQIASFTATTPQALLKGRIIFKSGDDIKAINANGTGEMTLLQTNENFKKAVISPDGRKIAAISRPTNGNDRIRTYNSDSTGKSGILHSAPVIGSIRWSQPIGSFLLFDKDIELPATGFTSTIFRMDFQGNNLTQMTNTNGNLLGRTYSPEYSSDGLSIIFGQKLLPAVSSIYRMNFDGSNPGQLIRSDFTPCRFPPSSSFSNPRWSPDGTKISFHRLCSPPQGSTPGPGVYIANADGSNPTFVFGAGCCFDWSPDGTRIALNSGGQLTAILPDGTDPIVIRQSEAEALDWGPDNSVATPSGSNTNVQTGSVSVTFNTTSGVNKTTTVTPIPPGSAGSVPGGFNIGNMAFEISTTANYTPPILVCFTIPPTSYTTQSAFDTLALMHNENGVLVDRTFTRVFVDRVVCGVVDSLSPFALGEIIDPALASVRGLVIDQNGNPMRDFNATLEGDEERFTTTAEDGTFTFSNLAPGGNYTVTPNQLGYFYDFPSQSYIGITGENTVVFTATATDFDISGLVKDGAGQPIANVILKLDGSVEAETITDANGRYSFVNIPANGSYTVSPSPDGNAYAPASTNIDTLQGDLTEVDFIQAAPTAAEVSISGRVITPTGQGIRGARLTLTAPDGTRRTAVTSSFGYYAFDGVEVGHTYVLEIASKKYTFANPTRVFNLQDTLTDMDFTSEPQ